MATTIKRSSKSARSTVKAQGRSRKARKVRARTTSAVGTVAGALPISENQWQRIFVIAILGSALILALVVGSYAGAGQALEQYIAGRAAASGFEVRRITVTGVARMNEQKVYERALAARDVPMPLVDLDGMREELLELNWVADARVSRQLPQTLAIDVVERVPHAVLKTPDKLVLIDGTGHELEPISKADARGMLIVTGPGAGRQVQGLAAMLDSAPALRPQVEEAEWIGNRRWNLTFRTGQVLALPQGDTEAASALVTFAQLDGKSRLLGGKVATFDMRAPERIYLRIPGRGSRIVGTSEE